MASIRARLTATYAAALVTTIVVFGATLWFRRGTSTQADLAQEARARVESARLLAEFIRVRESVARPQPIVEVRDSNLGPQVVRELYAVLDAVPGFVVLADSTGFVLYGSLETRLLEAGGAAAIVQNAIRAGRSRAATFAAVRDTADRTRAAAWRARGLPQREDILVVGTMVDSSLAPVRYIVAGLSRAPVAAAQRELLDTMLGFAPLLLLASVAVAYYMAGATLRPLATVRTELEAITDGRSLHRRLQADDLTGDEMARLVLTLNEMIERLQTSFGALRRFTADASHELKTPLTVLRANVERAMSAPPGSQEQLVALEEALQENARMANLVDSLLTLARFDEGRFDLHREPIELAPLVHDIFETAVILGEAATLSISLPTCDAATVLGDAARLRQLFLNLVTNAIKYTPAGGTVELSLRRVEDSVTFSVRDTGIGISAADLPFIFDRFWRADRARSRRVLADDGTPERGGFGLGLAISQWISQAHGGTLTVASRLTRGSTFTVTLPTLTAGPPSSPTADASRPIVNDAPV